MAGKPAYPMLCGLCADKPTRLSQAMHNAAFRAAGLTAFYVAFDTSDTAGAIQAMRTLGIRGLSMTLPHKEAGIPLVDEVRETASVVGALNTIVNDNGKLFGENTDVDGIVRAFAEADSGNLAGKKVLLLGAGGAARAAVLAFVRLGASEIVLSNRTESRAVAVARELRERLKYQGRIDTLPWSGLDRLAGQFDVIANTTAVGSHLSADAGILPSDSLQAGQLVFDAVTRDTPLLQSARERGCRTISGERMLLHQAVRQFELFTGLSQAPLKEMEEALRLELQAN